MSHLDPWDPREELTGLTALRGLAAIGVVLYHVEIVLARHELVMPLGVFRSLVEHGYLFVDLFFVLSGLVIAHVYGQRKLLDRRHYRNFLINRLARIYPMHLAVVAILLLPVVSRFLSGESPAFEAPNTAGALATELLLLDALGIHDALTWNEMSWSVSAEWFSYMLAPVLVLLVQPGRAGAPAAAVALGTAWVGLFLLTDRGELGHATFGLGAVRGILGFTIGVALYRLHRLTRVQRFLSHRWAFPAAVAASLLVMSAPISDAIAIAPFSALVISSIYLDGFGKRVLHSRPLMWLGQISYSLYLLQMVALSVFVAYVAGFSEKEIEATSAADMWLWTVIVLVGLIAVSSLTYRRIERPGQSMIRRLARPQSPVGALEKARAHDDAIA